MSLLHTPANAFTSFGWNTAIFFNTLTDSAGTSKTFGANTTALQGHAVGLTDKGSSFNNCLKNHTPSNSNYSLTIDNISRAPHISTTKGSTGATVASSSDYPMTASR